jgi:hypothetical protein
MSRAPVKLPPVDSELARLVEAMCDGTIAPTERDRLESLLAGDRDAKLYYVAYMDLHAEMQWLMRDDGSALGLPVSGLDVASAVQLPGEPSNSQFSAPPIILDLSPTSHSPLLALHSSAAGFVFSYAVSALIIAIGLLIGLTWKVQSYPPAELVGSHRPESREAAPPAAPSVGRITGMVDCRWAWPQSEPRVLTHDPVSPGQVYPLCAGFVEITYDSGAKVILQGPCNYKVESARGGFLSLGRLTAKVQSRESGVERPDRQRDDSRPSTLDSRLFSVRTPTAVVTDLGTEFGVEVDQSGVTRSHVFQGKVEVRSADPALANQSPVVLSEGQSARLDAAGLVRQSSRAAGAKTNGLAQRFVRRLPLPVSVRTIDLLDVVAGGDGAGHRRERGIDLATGMQDTYFNAQGRDCDSRYHPTAWHNLIDGVFVPNGGAGPVQLDSARHTFGGFPRTSGRTWGGIWARTADVKPQGREESRNRWVYLIGRCEQYAPQGRGLLCLHANAGITFNIEALRKSHQGLRPARFSATAGLVPTGQAVEGGRVDFWIFADGRLLWSRKSILPKDGPIPLDVEIGPGDRFLTLAVTDGGNGITADWFVLGDPVLQLAPVVPADSAASADGDASEVPLSIE